MSVTENEFLTSLALTFAAVEENADPTALFQSAAISESGDAAGDIVTTASFEVGDTFSGTITNGDTDFIAISLEAGDVYSFFVWGEGGATAGLDDTYIAIHDSTGDLIAWNDNVEDGVNPFSLVEFEASYTGTYYVAISGSNAETGDYTVQSAGDIWSVDQVVNYLTNFGWGTSASLHFQESSTNSVTYYVGNLTGDGRQLVEWALEAWSTVTGIDFERVSRQTSAELVFSDGAEDYLFTYGGTDYYGAAGQAYGGPAFYNPENGNVALAIVNVGKNWLAQDATYDSYWLQTYIHEIGHALGLSHTGPYDGAATYSENLLSGDNLYLNDSTQLSIMSYFDGFPDAYNNSYIDADPAYVVTPMVADIAAVEALYGSTNAYGGNTVWGNNNNLGGYLGGFFSAYFDGYDPQNIYSGNDVAFTIFDTGGNDTLDLSGTAFDQVIDMRPEGVSDIYGVAGSMVIARNTVIENLIAGQGDDTIYMFIGDGTIRGGAGTDTLVIDANRADVTEDFFGAGFSVTLGSDTKNVSGVDRVQYNDQTVDGLAVGRNEVTGSGTFSGTADHDFIQGSAGADDITGGAGSDIILGNGGDDVIDGGAGDNFIWTGNGADILYGGDDDDTIGGGGGNDYIDGGAGDDFLGGGAGNDEIHGGTGNDTIGGGPGNDLIYGGSGNDFLAGGSGNDTIYGGVGADIIVGGTGDDVMYGANGLGGDGAADQFNINEINNGERDEIYDFEIGLDTVRIIGVENEGSTYRGFFDALTITDVAGGAEVTYGGHTIYFDQIDADELTYDSFSFL